MKLVIVHYHFRPGGIRRVIELATPHLLRALGPGTAVELVGGEATDENWIGNFKSLINPAKFKITTNAALGYVSEQKTAPARIHAQISATLKTILADATPANCLVWAHNLGIGRNLLLTDELARACAARGITLISHHHDWWFDNRWLRWPEIRRTGFPTLKSLAQAIFPQNPALRHAAINHEEAALLARHLPDTSAWGPNLATRQTPPKAPRVQHARQWLKRNLDNKDTPVWILPCRLLRRKNVAEALLLTRWLRPEAWLVTTGGASSADELAYFEKLQRTAQQHHWRLRLGILQGDEQQKPTIPELLAASEAVLLTSIQEGFGLPYLEAAAAGRPLIARNLPNVAPDLKQFGFRFPQAYDEILVAPELFDWKAEYSLQKKLFARWRRNLPASLRDTVGTPVVLTTQTLPRAVPFSRLSLTAQLEVLAQPAATSWHVCAPLNAFLPVWQSRAQRGALQVTPWPRRADQVLSGRTYAARLLQLAQPVAHESREANASRLQADFFRKKLCPGNLYPLLWEVET